jgi:hypothetical protein
VTAGYQRCGLAFDDAGALYIAVFGRMGDGVSGCDVASGGYAAYDAGGVLLWSCPHPKGHPPAEVYGLAASAVFRGFDSRCFGAEGEVLWHERDDGALTPLPELGVTIRTGERPAGAPYVIQQRAERCSEEALLARDAGGNCYFGCVAEGAQWRYGLLVSLNGAGRVRWTMPLPMIEQCAPAIGPAGTVLVACGAMLLAIG